MTGIQKLCDGLRTIAILAILLASAGNSDAARFGLSADARGNLLLKGQPFRGIGVNYYDAFARLLDTGKISEVDAGFRVLASNQIPFIRFSAGGYWPMNWGLYQTNRMEYFERLDRVAGGMQAHWLATVEAEDGDKPVCVAQLLARYYPADRQG